MTTRSMAVILRSIVLENSNRDIVTAAKMLKIGRSALSKVLNGHCELSIELAVKIEDVFRYSAYELLRRQLEMKLLDYRTSTGSRVLPVLRSSPLSFSKD